MATKKTHEAPEPDPSDIGKIDIVQVMCAVDGCVIDWANAVQINPQTGQKFDFDGHLL